MADPAHIASSDIELSVVLIDIGVLSMMGVTAIAIARLRSLFALVMLSGVYSLLSATWFVIVDAVDVGFTEAAVGGVFAPISSRNSATSVPNAITLAAT